MTRSLAAKLTAAFLLVALTAALLVAVVIRLTSAEALDRLIIEQQRGEFSQALAAYYAANGSWAGVRDYFYPGPGHIGAGEGGPGPYRRNWRDLFGLANAQGVVVIPVMFGGPAAGSTVPAAVLARGEPVVVDGQVVGTILTAANRPGLNPEEAAYLQRTYRALALASGGAVLVALVMGVVLARTLTRPLHALTQATHRMAGGQLEQEVAVGADDEIGQLAQAFNQMSRRVAQANNARKQMTADVAHELRTPLTVIAGYVEAMREGVLPPTPERLGVIYTELEHLQHLVGDLRLLSQADAGELKLNRQRLELAELLEQARRAFEHLAAQKGVRLELDTPSPLPSLEADENRLAQVLANLLTNALRYTPQGGRVSLSAHAEPGGAVITVADTGSGIAAEDLPFVFDRFYRGDKSRSDAEGESGLGLAIAKAIVEAHGGSIAVESTAGQGTTFRVRLPSDD